MEIEKKEERRDNCFPSLSYLFPFLSLSVSLSLSHDGTSHRTTPLSFSLVTEIFVTRRDCASSPSPSSPLPFFSASSLPLLLLLISPSLAMENDSAERRGKPLSLSLSFSLFSSLSPAISLCLPLSTPFSWATEIGSIACVFSSSSSTLFLSHFFLSSPPISIPFRPPPPPTFFASAPWPSLACLSLSRDGEKFLREERRTSSSDLNACCLTGTMWGERNDINGPNSSKLKSWYPTILIELGAKILWAWFSFQALRIC